MTLERLYDDCVGNHTTVGLKKGKSSTATCWADGVGIIHDINSYARVQWARMAQAHTAH